MSKNGLNLLIIIDNILSYLKHDHNNKNYLFYLFLLSSILAACRKGIKLRDLEMFKRSLLVAMLATVTAAQAAPLTKDNGHLSVITKTRSLRVHKVQLCCKMYNWFKNCNVLAVSAFLNVWFTHVVQVLMVNSLLRKICLI